MAKRKPKPDPVVDLTAAEAEAHALADGVTDPAAFEFPIPPSAASAGAAAADGGDPSTPTVAAGPVRPEGGPARDADARRRTPDPFPVASITLGTEKDSPRVRLFRGERLKQVAIRFDEKPDEKYRQMLRDAGFKWRSEEGVWTRQFDPDARWRTVGEAEKLFEAVGNALRSDLGLPPVRVLGG